jgi:hypothetical protein
MLEVEKNPRAMVRLERLDKFNPTFQMKPLELARVWECPLVGQSHDLHVSSADNLIMRQGLSWFLWRYG